MMIAYDGQEAIEDPAKPVFLIDYATPLLHSLNNEEDTPITTRVNDLNSDTFKVAT